MTGLIKSYNAVHAPGVRAYDHTRGQPSVPAIDPRQLALQQELDRTTVLLGQKDAEISRLVEALDAAFKDGEAKGREAAAKEAAANREALVATIEGAIDRSLALLERDLSSMERLAAVLATESLEKIFGSPCAFTDIAAQTIRHQLEQLDLLSVVRIQVSAADFDAKALSALNADVRQPALDIQATEELSSGECKIKLALGALEIGASQQWSRLKSILEELASPGEALS